jgi:hypothetical protein
MGFSNFGNGRFAAQPAVSRQRAKQKKRETGNGIRGC